MADIVLAAVPFGPLFAPSLALSLLESGLTRAGFSVRTRYLTLDFAERIGEELYTALGEGGRTATTDLAGEWLFAQALFAGDEGSRRRFVDQVLRVPRERRRWGRRPPERLIARLLAAREQIEPFLERSVTALLHDSPRLVGLTSTFQQHAAALALASRLKARSPQLLVVLGGGNCEGAMGARTAHRFPFVDAVVSGEGDRIFPELCARALGGRGLEDLPGVYTPRLAGAALQARRFPSAPPVARMDDLPVPDHGGFFADFARSRFARTWQPHVFLETARGCWWGEKSHCSFCGLNGATMAFRRKSPGRALAELEALVKRHPGTDIHLTDNILALDYFQDLLPALAQRRLGVELFWETKSNLRREQVRLLAAAGVRRIQPGIESLSDPVLRLMGKGVSALHNVALLKWCRELGVAAYWNILWGFPGEDPAEYARIAGWIPQLLHLKPPVGWGQIRMDRFSPSFERAGELGFTGVEPLPAYRHIWRGLAEPALADLAYFFDYGYREERDVAGYTALLDRRLRGWERSHSRSLLISIESDERLILIDTRATPRYPVVVLEGQARRDWAQLDSPGPLSTSLEPLQRSGHVLVDGSRALALAVARAGSPPPPRPALRRAAALLESARATGRELVLDRLAPGILAVRGRPAGRAVQGWLDLESLELGGSSLRYRLKKSRIAV